MITSGEFDVVPARLDWFEALAEGDEAFRARFGIRASPGWSGFPEALPELLEAVRTSPGSRWGPLLLVSRNPTTVIGLGGWKGEPNESGTAELGYAVAPEFRRRGIASAFVRRLLIDAAGAGAQRAVAHTLAGDNPSVQVLRANDFDRTAEFEDPDEQGALVWRWEHALRADSGDAHTA